MHKKLIHRGAKVVYEKFKEQGETKYSENDIRETIKDCYICKAYNPIRLKKFRSVEAFEPGERIGIDILEPRRGLYFATAIDYFSRKGFAAYLKSKNTEGVLKFIKSVYNELPFKTLVSDNARENTSDMMKKWMLENKITHHVTSPHHHQSNGRVERFNRTILEGLNKLKMRGTINMRLKEVIERYNQSYHNTIKMSPEKALDPQNWNKVKQNQFESRIKDNMQYLNGDTWPKLQINEKVLIKQEDQPKFKEQGKVLRELGYDTYLIQVDERKPFKRHISQLRSLKKDEKEC